MRQSRYQPAERVRRRHAPQSRTAALLVGLLALAVGAGMLMGLGRAAVVAAPSTHDGLSRVALARPLELVADPVPVAEPVQVPLAALVADGQAAVAPVVAARPPLVAPHSDQDFGEFYVHVPPVISGRLRVLVALHGMGQEAHSFCEALLARADFEDWVIVAPTYNYGDWRDPNQVAREESSRFIPRLHEFLQELPGRTGLDLEPRAALLGFSRGAQLAQRFAMIYPEQTLAVAAFSAGTYTLPESQAQAQGRNVRLAYPLGTADVRERFGRGFDGAALQRIPFLVGVGADDRNPADLPRQWDPYLGDNRVARAQAIVGRLTDLGVAAELVLFPGVGHGLNDAMRLRAFDFIAGL
jgi:pimeloyl-ACP methyl ester carboxylesterase